MKQSDGKRRKRHESEKTGAKVYIAIVLVAVLALFLANPDWLPLSAELKASITETERSNLIFTHDGKTTVAQLVTWSWPFAWSGFATRS